MWVVEIWFNLFPFYPFPLFGNWWKILYFLKRNWPHFLVYFLEIGMSLHVFENVISNFLEDFSERRNLLSISYQIVWGFSAFMCLGIFPLKHQNLIIVVERLNIFHTLFLKFIPYKEHMEETYIVNHLLMVTFGVRE